MAGYSASNTDASSSAASGSADRSGNNQQRISGLNMAGMSRPVPEFPFGQGSRAATVAGGAGSLLESPAVQWGAILGVLLVGLFVMRRK